MPARFPVGIHDHDFPIRLQALAKVPEEGVGRLHLVVHVDEKNPVERARGKVRVVGRAEHHRDIVELLAVHTLREKLDRLGDDVLSKDSAPLSDDRGKPDCVISFAGADVGDGHTRRHFGQPDDLLGFPEAIPRILRREGVADDRGDVPADFREIRFFGDLATSCQGGRHHKRDLRPTPHPRPRPARR